jgi:anti-sigma B factor antagonist
MTSMTQPSSKLRIAEKQVDDLTVLTLSGEITADDGDIAFGKYVDELIKRGHLKIVVNLAEVSYIDSAGVGMMVAEARILKQGGGLMKLSNLSGRSHRVLAMLKLKTVFEVFDDDAAALQSFSWGSRE